MYRYALLVFGLLILSCKTDRTPTYETIASAAITNTVEASFVGPLIHPHPYDLKMNIDKLEGDLFNFEVSMKLFNGAHYISPNAVRGFSGKFTIHIDENPQLEIDSELIETPRSVEEVDPHPFTDGKVNWVRVDTKYNQKLKPTVETDFDVKGFIQFTIEPRCTLENIPIIIKYRDGDMRVEKFGC